VSTQLLTTGCVNHEAVGSTLDTVAQRVMDNEDIAKRFFDDEEFKQVLIAWYAEKVYRRARE